MSDLAKRIIEECGGKDPGNFHACVIGICKEELAKKPEPAPKPEKKAKKKAAANG